MRSPVLSLLVVLMTLGCAAQADARPVQVRAADGLVRGREPARASAAALPSQTDGLQAAWGEAPEVPPFSGPPPVIAIVDSGVDLAHPDLVANLWTNPGEIPGNGIDDDHNGYVDDVHGADIVDPGTAPYDQYGHGTAVAGVAAASGADGDVAGAAPGARIMVVRVLGDDGHGDTGKLAEGIAYAAHNGASVINCSLTSPADAADVDAAISAAEDAGIPVVASAGNDGRDLAQQPQYPAASDPRVISVAATSGSGTLAYFSNFGRSSVTIAAPGVGLLTTLPHQADADFSGTSAATPLVSATLALERAQNPQATLQQLRDALMETATRTGLPVISGELQTPLAVAQAALRPPAGATASRQAPVAPPKLVVSDARISRRSDLVRVRWRLEDETRPAVRVTLIVRAGSSRGRLIARQTTVARATTGRFVTRATTRAVARTRLWLEVRVATTQDGPVTSARGVLTVRRFQPGR